ncbi:MAG TPA: hypothetical protein VM925_19225, partial [Labilithrix sp.]|nr:hypothetical protein [Labilithrix sp.]
SEKLGPDGKAVYACDPPEAPPFVAEKQSVVGAWEQVINNPSMPNSVASDTMRHVFNANGTVTVRMEETKPATFKWTFDQGKHFVAYKYGEFDHKREFHLRSADEAEVLENGKVLDTYVREGSALAHKKTPVALFGGKGSTDVSALAIGKSYVLDRETPLMPDPDPADPIAAIAKMKKVPAGSSFSILGKRSVGNALWYQVKVGSDTGWFNKTALLGQTLTSK